MIQPRSSCTFINSTPIKVLIVASLAFGVSALFCGASGLTSPVFLSIATTISALLAANAGISKSGPDWVWLIDGLGLVVPVLCLFAFGERPLMFNVAMILFITGFGLNLVRKLSKKGASAEEIEKWEVRS